MVAVVIRDLAPFVNTHCCNSAIVSNKKKKTQANIVIKNWSFTSEWHFGLCDYGYPDEKRKNKLGRKSDI